jgi:hypothetical protein
MFTKFTLYFTATAAVLLGFYFSKDALLQLISNGPPLFEVHAREYLENSGIDPKLISKLTDRLPISDVELVRLSKFSNASVQYLVASNPGASSEFLTNYSMALSIEGWWGLVSNGNAPQDLVLKKRQKGQYATINGYIARNPSLPKELIWEMYRGREASDYDFAVNTNLPDDLAHELIQKDEMVRIGLAINLGISISICRHLQSDSSELVRRNLRKKCSR